MVGEALLGWSKMRQIFIQYNKRFQGRQHRAVWPLKNVTDDPALFFLLPNFYFFMIIFAA